MYQPKLEPKDDKSIVYLNPDGSSDDSSAKADSKDDKDEPKKEVHKNDDYNEYEENDNDPLQDKTMDDKDW